MQRFGSGERPSDVTAASKVGTLADGGRADRVVESVHGRNGQQLFGFGLRLGLSEDEANDLVQDVMLRLLRSLERGDEITEPSAWAFRVAYRVAMDRHRLRRRWRAFAERMGPASASRTPPMDDLIAVWSEVDRLPARQRAVLYLRFRADLTYDAIGHVLDIDASSARATASRGLATLRERLEDR